MLPGRVNMPARDESHRSDCIDPEPSPSAGHRDVVDVLDATAGADHTRTCDVLECDRDADPIAVVDLATDEIIRRGVLCRDHARDVLGVST